MDDLPAGWAENDIMFLLVEETPDGELRVIWWRAEEGD